MDLVTGEVTPRALGRKLQARASASVLASDGGVRRAERLHLLDRGAHVLGLDHLLGHEAHPEPPSVTAERRAGWPSMSSSDEVHGQASSSTIHP